MERLSRSEIIFKLIAYLLVAAFALVALYPLIYAVSASIFGPRRLRNRSRRLASGRHRLSSV
ncbi:MAG: hypothetical protein MZU97_26275 [Bacillus subtilis]|nr:hypothetical protein [Bacillus subtilis]